MKIFNWIFSIFCILCLPVYGFHIGSILMCLLGIASLPIDAIKGMWRKIPANKILRPLIIGFLFTIFVFLVPTETTNSNNNTITENSSQEAIEEISTEKDIEEPIINNLNIEQTEVEVNKETKLEEIEVSEQNVTEEIETEETENQNTQTELSTEIKIKTLDIPAYSGKPYIEINGNVPQFVDSDMTTTSYEYYSELDDLGRCGVALACIGQDLMPTEERGNIGSIKPTGWHSVKYDIVDGKFLYNRCHLIGYQLTGENANENNLITDI